MKLLPYILFEKIYLYFSIGHGQLREMEPALCQLYRHILVPYTTPGAVLTCARGNPRSQPEEEKEEYDGKDLHKG